MVTYFVYFLTGHILIPSLPLLSTNILFCYVMCKNHSQTPLPNDKYTSEYISAGNDFRLHSNT